MKLSNIATGILTFIFLVGLFIFTSDYYLISGSDVVDFSRHFPHWMHILLSIAIVTLLAIRWLRKKVPYLRLVLGLVVVLALLSSQALVVSGKSNTIRAYLYGIRVGEIPFDPGIGYEKMINESKLGCTIISDNKNSLYIITGFCPACINMEGL